MSFLLFSASKRWVATDFVWLYIFDTGRLITSSPDTVTPVVLTSLERFSDGGTDS